MTNQRTNQMTVPTTHYFRNITGVVAARRDRGGYLLGLRGKKKEILLLPIFSDGCSKRSPGQHHWPEQLIGIQLE